MCAGLFSEKVQFFLCSATTLDNRIQHDIKHMVEYVVQPNNSLRGLDSSFYRVLNLPFGTCSFLNSLKLVIPLHSLYWSVVNSHQRWKQTRNRVCFHLCCELTLALWCHSIVWSLFHEIKCNGMTSFMEFMICEANEPELRNQRMARLL